MNQQALINQLQTGLETLGLMLAKETQKKLIEFLCLLKKWNQSINLTAIDDLPKMVVYHLLDSLVVAPYLKVDRILDVGTGAGLPGIPLALAFPEKKFVLLEKNHKKVSFLLQVKAALKLDNIEIVASRVENYHTQECFGAIIFRAVGKMKDLMKQSLHLLCQGGQFLFMKGTYPEKELAAIHQTSDVIVLQVPGLEAKRHLIIVGAK